MQEKGYACNEKDYEKMKNFQKRKSVPQLYPSLEESMALEFGAKYLASLSDTEFMDLLRATGKVNHAKFKSLTRKYKEIDLPKEYMTHRQFDELSAEQNLATQELREVRE